MYQWFSATLGWNHLKKSILYTHKIFGYILQHINDFLCSKTVLPSNHYIRLHFANILSQFWLTNLLVKGVFLHTVLYGRISVCTFLQKMAFWWGPSLWFITSSPYANWELEWRNLRLDNGFLSPPSSSFVFPV